MTLGPHASSAGSLVASWCVLWAGLGDCKSCGPGFLGMRSRSVYYNFPCRKITWNTNMLALFSALPSALPTALHEGGDREGRGRGGRNPLPRTRKTTCIKNESQ